MSDNSDKNQPPPPLKDVRSTIRFSELHLSDTALVKGARLRISAGDPSVLIDGNAREVGGGPHMLFMPLTEGKGKTPCAVIQVITPALSLSFDDLLLSPLSTSVGRIALLR